MKNNSFPFLYLLFLTTIISCSQCERAGDSSSERGIIDVEEEIVKVKNARILKIRDTFKNNCPERDDCVDLCYLTDTTHYLLLFDVENISTNKIVLNMVDVVVETSGQAERINTCKQSDKIDQALQVNAVYQDTFPLCFAQIASMQTDSFIFQLVVDSSQIRIAQPACPGG